MKKNKNNGKQGFVRPKNRGLCVNDTMNLLSFKVNKQISITFTLEKLIGDKS